MTFKRLLSFVLSFMLIFGASFAAISNGVQAATGKVTFSINADRTELHRGDEVMLSVNLSDNNDMAGLEAVFSYDSEKLELISDEDDMYGSSCDDFGRKDVSDIVKLQDGKIKVTLARTEEIISNGSILNAKFKVKETAKGSIVTDFTAELSDLNYNNVEYEVVNNISSMKVVIPATGISLDKQSLTLAKGSTETLKATLTPADSEEAVTWTTSDNSVATVDNTGKVTAVGKGTATITAKVGSYTASCKVTVNVPLNGISIKGDATTIKKGQTTQLSVIYDPEDTTDAKTVTWSSSDSSVASVNANGLVTALKDGTATITAKAGDKSATYDITVQEVKLTSISIKDSTSIHKGEKETLEIAYAPENTTDSKTATWTSSDTSVVTVDGNGTLTAVAPGSAVVTAKVGNFTDTCTVTVDAPLKGIVPTAATMELIKNQTATITYTLNPTDTTDAKNVTFTSSDPSIVTVDADGKLTAKKTGTATITLTGANNVTAEVTVNVSEVPISTVTLDAQSKVIEKGASADLKASIGPKDNTDDDQTITWTSSDTSVATVTVDSADTTKATVTAIPGSKGGTVTITASAWNGTKAVCEIKVPNHIESIELEKDVVINKGNTKILDVMINPENTDDDTTVVWATSNPNVATVDESTGMITGIKEGTAEITVATKALNPETQQRYTATTTVTVKENHLTDELAGTIAFADMENPLFKGQTVDLNRLLNLSAIIAENQITDDITVEWESADEEIATVDQNGSVLGIKAGTVEIAATVKAVDGSGNEKTYQVVTSIEVKEIPLESIAFDKVINEMQVGATETLKVIYNPENTTDLKDIKWSSSDENVLAVEDGKLTAKKAGTATITATVGDKTVSCTITVKDTDQKETMNQKPGTNGTNKSDKNNGQGSVKGVKTGDNTNVALYVILMIGAAAIVSASLRIRNRRVNH